MFFDKIENEIYIQNSTLININAVLGIFQILFSKLTIQNSSMQNLVAIKDYVFILFQSSCFTESTKVINSSTGFINLKYNCNITIINCSFSHNNFAQINKEMSFLSIKSNQNVNISISVEQSVFDNMIGSDNGTVIFS